ncbi:MAG: MOSC domain-containing protein [Opitutaceae bacterium]
MHVSALHLHPVKSLRGCAVESVVIDRRGIAGDRRFLVTDPAGRFLTQRTLPRMALIATKLDDLELTLEAPGHGMIRVARASQPDAARAKVSVWSSEGLIAEDCGDTVAGWLSDFLATPCRLVRAGEDFTRAVRKAPVDMTGAEVGFADAYPGLLLTEASWADLNDRLREPGDEKVERDATQEFAGLGDGRGDRGPGVRERLAGVLAQDVGVKPVRFQDQDLQRGGVHAPVRSGVRAEAHGAAVIFP